MKSKLIYLLLFFCGNFFSQNLVPNGDFEEYSKLPTVCDEMPLATGWMKLRGSPDFYHTDGYFKDQFGPIKPISGKGQAGICTWVDGHSTFRECISAKLIKPMVKGEKYVVSFYLSNGKGNGWTYTTGNMGVYFSRTEVKKGFDESILLEPQCEVKEQIVIDNGWKKYTFYYTPDAAMEYINFGNFRSNDSTNVSAKGTSGAYYFIDKIVVIPEKNYKPDADEIVQQTITSVTAPKEVEIIEQKYDATNSRTKTAPVKEAARK